MTNELQADEGEITLNVDPIESDDSQESETVENGAELAPAPEGEQDKTEDSEKASIEESTRKAINKQHAKYREEERKRIAAEKEAQTLKEKLDAIEAKNGEVHIPDLPDPFDDDYEEKVKLRDEAIMQKAQRDAQQQSIIERQNANKEAADKAEQERVNSLINGYAQQVTKLGLNAEDINKAGDTVVSYGIDAGVAEFILGDEDGPLITQYLANNPLELDDLRNLPPIQAAMRIDSMIRPKAALNKPQASAAPDPAETLAGRGAGEKVSPFIAGAKFE